MRGKPSHVPSHRRRRSTCPSQPRPAIPVVPSPAHSLEPEAEGDRPGRATAPSCVSSWGRRNVRRSTIYSGSPVDTDVAMKKTYEGRHHSPWRRSVMGPPSWHWSGSSSRSSRPPVIRSTDYFTASSWKRVLGPLADGPFSPRITSSPVDSSVRFAASTPSHTANAGQWLRSPSSFLVA